MKLSVSYQQECMWAGGFAHYLIIIIVRLYLHDIAGNHNYELQLLIELLMHCKPHN